jgi:hypothetical protein
VAQLPEQPAWRRFARLRRTLPTARMLHEFRQTVGVGGLRCISNIWSDDCCIGKVSSPTQWR